MNEYLFFKLPVLLVVCSMVATAENLPDVTAIRPEIFPEGMYPGAEAVPPETGIGLAREAGEFEVLSGLSNVTIFENAASKGDTSEAGFIFRNLRIKSTQTNLDDYLNGYYSFDPSTQRLLPLKFERAPQLGIFEISESILMKDAADPVSFHLNPLTPNQFVQGTIHNFQSDTDYYSNLVAGQRLCLTFGGIPQARLVRLVMLTENGSVYMDERVVAPSSGALVISAAPILISGKYRLRLEAVSPATSFSYQIRFFNENLAVTTAVNPGSNISVSLAGSAGGFGVSYRKFSISLSEGQTLNVPADLDTRTFLIDRRGKIVGGGSNAGMNVPVTETGTYYIVIQARDALSTTNESYSGTVTVTQSLAFTDWAGAHGLVYGKDGSGDDADGDGMTNLMEYAFGSDPKQAGGSTALTQEMTPTHQKVRFRRPAYVTGVTMTPQFTGPDFNWQNGVAQTVGTEGSRTIFELLVPRSQAGKGFARIRVATTP